LPTLNETQNGLETCALFDHSDWKRVRFGDVVENLNETERNPEEAGIERFIGLEHLEPGSLHIRAWGNVADGTTFTRRCRPGQVLFGKRRAYQRKVAIAEFDAVVSGDIYVLESKNDHLLPALLPFLCMSERFFKFAVETSAGSLSPRTNWSHLAQFAFALPPLDQQRRIAEILWAVDEAVQKATDTEKTSDQAELVVLKDLFGEIDSRPHWQACNLEDLGEIKIGRQKSPKFTQGVCPRPYLKVGNISDGRLKLDTIETMDFDDAALTMYGLRFGDILLTEGDLVSASNVGRSAMFRGEIEGCGYQNHLIRLRCREGVNPEFGLQLMRYLFHTGVFAKAAKRTTVISMGVGRVSKIPVRIPGETLQTEIADTMRRIDELRRVTETRVQTGRTLIQQLTNTVLGLSL
jgi:type I restriction enzyme S subunit